MSNWWNVIKQNKLVNLPKFKVKPFNVAKPNEEDRECRDKIMEIIDFTKRYQFPSEIGGDFVRVKEVSNPYMVEDSKFSTMHYGSKKTRTKMWIDRYFAVGNIDDIPEEVFCTALDLLKAGVSANTTLMDYEIDVAFEDSRKSYTQQLIIRKQDIFSRNMMTLRLIVLWYDWFNYEDGMYDENPPLSSEEESNIALALRQEADNMRWPI